MEQPLSSEELTRLDADLATRNPRPHPDLPEVPAPGSNIEYLSKAEHDRVMGYYAMNLQAFARQSGRVSEHEERLKLERTFRRS